MIGKAALVVLKNGNAYMGIVTFMGTDVIEIHVWDEKRDKLSDSIQRMQVEDALLVRMPAEGFENENWIRNRVEEQSKARQAQAIEAQRQMAANSAPRIQRPM